MRKNKFSNQVEEIITLALNEDVSDATAKIPRGDHSSAAIFKANTPAKAKLLVKEDGIIAGIALAQLVFNQVDAHIQMTAEMEDGALVKKGDIAFHAMGNVQSLLTAERVVLNFMQRLSGIATTVHEYVEAIKGTGTKLLDTRKTTPGMRELEKWAVKLGGAYNHRMGLFDMIMLKDNHVDFCGGVENALAETHRYLKENHLQLPIEIETRNLDEVKKVMTVGGVQRIMLDNFSPEKIKEALVLIAGKYETEASGGITLSNIRSYAETGVDFISVGALTHSVKSLDLSFKAEVL